MSTILITRSRELQNLPDGKVLTAKQIAGTALWHILAKVRTVEKLRMGVDKLGDTEKGVRRVNDRLP